jgi:superfamily I DNA/RNA helicase
MWINPRGIDRTTFVRQAANLWKIKDRLQSHLQSQIDGDALVTITRG